MNFPQKLVLLLESINNKDKIKGGSKQKLYGNEFSIIELVTS